MNYEDLQSASKSMHETNDCGVKALAVVAGLSYEEAHAKLARNGRTPRKGTPDVITRKVLSALGYKTEPVIVKAKTVRTLGRELKYRQGAYLVWTSNNRHILAIRDGKVCDWTKGRLHRIHRVEKVVRVDQSLACNSQPGADNGQS